MRLVVSLSRSEAESLLAIATAERRRPNEQASVLLARVLARADRRRRRTHSCDSQPVREEGGQER